MVPKHVPPGYYFMSFGSLHTGRSIGACIVLVEEGEDPNEKCARLGLMPLECNEAQWLPLARRRPAIRNHGSRPLLFRGRNAAAGLLHRQRT